MSSGEEPESDVARRDDFVLVISAGLCGVPSSLNVAAVVFLVNHNGPTAVTSEPSRFFDFALIVAPAVFQHDRQKRRSGLRTVDGQVRHTPHQCGNPSYMVRVRMCDDE